MNIDKLVRKAITEIKLKWGLPDKGFIAGGSVANLVWNYCSEHKAIVNDIDVFLVSKEDKSFVFEYESKGYKYTESYRHLQQQLQVKNKYKIYSVSRHGMLNTISISEDANPISILESFDINATCVGYSIEEDKVYYLESFKDFLETGNLKIVNMMTPAHTAIRLVKKKYDLNASIDEYEFRIVQFCLMNRHFEDFDRFRFQNKYAETFSKYEEDLSKYFKLQSCDELQEWLSKAKEKEIKLFELKNIDSEELSEFNRKSLNAMSGKYLLTTNDMLFYFRNIMGNEKLEKIWSKLSPLIKREDYLDDSTDEQIEFITKFIELYPGCITNLSEYKLIEQYKLVNEVVNKIGKEFDIDTAAKVIEFNKINPNEEIDEFDVTILGLRANRKIRKLKGSETEIELPF